MRMSVRGVSSRFGSMPDVETISGSKRPEVESPMEREQIKLIREEVEIQQES